MQIILVIDDDESLRDTIGLMLENEGFKPVLMADGSSGLDEGSAGHASGHGILSWLKPNQSVRDGQRLTVQ